MIRGIGTDLCKLERIEGLLEKFGDRLHERVLAPGEDVADGARAMARRWAIKEAVVKALGTGIGGTFGWRDIMIAHGDGGQPLCTVKGLEDGKVQVSVSDDGDYAVAFAVWEVA